MRDNFKIIRNGDSVVLVDLMTCQKKVLNESEYKGKTDDEIIKTYKSLCVKSKNRKA